MSEDRNGNAANATAPEITLRRSIGLPLLTLYGLGTTIGGGIYVLVGQVAARAGIYAPVSFLLAALMVLFTALTFAELATRYPKAAGEAVYVKEGLRAPRLAMVVGLLVVFNGIVSSAALANGFVGYFQTILAVPSWLAIVAVVASIVALACWGIGESVTVAALVTILEIGGLLAIVWVGADTLGKLADDPAPLLPPLETGIWGGILAGSFLAFYAFIGFEDMVNVAEEVKNPGRTMPLAIVMTLLTTAVIYCLVTLVAILAVPLAELAASDAPLALIFEQRTGRPATLISLVSILAVLNGALIQIIMAARVLYGMSKQGWLTQAFGRLNPTTRTPVTATLTVGAVSGVLALGFGIEVLAESTALVILLIAIAVNASLWRLKLNGEAATGTMNLPLLVPVLGLAVSGVYGFLLVRNMLYA